MIFRPYYYFDLGCAAYLFGCGTLGRCAVVDARLDDVEAYDKLLTLPGDLEIYPGHFSGSVCGTGLSGKPTSTIAFERRWNPVLSLDRQAFIVALTNVPPKPDGMERILAFNRGHRSVEANA